MSASCTRRRPQREDVLRQHPPVRASGSTGYVPANLATNYVYTFVNDLGEESAPSEASATILRPDGISVTVTTPVVVPSGVSSDYAITTYLLI